jgi:endoglucanase
LRLTELIDDFVRAHSSFGTAGNASNWVTPARECGRRLRSTWLDYTKLAFLFACVTAVPEGAAHAANCSSNRQLTGVNLSGAEFNGNKLPGVHGQDYTYPHESDLQYFRSLGFEAVRLSVRWERLQPELSAPLSNSELALIDKLAGKAVQLDLCVILDIHNYGSYRGKAIGLEGVPVESFVDLWRQLAERFGQNGNMAFGLMNEPSALPIDRWQTIAQTTVNAIRQSGARNLILVSGGRWSGAHAWNKRIGTVSNAEVFTEFRDPGNRLLIEMHQYADSDYSGTHFGSCVSVAKMQDIMNGASNWARASGHKLFLGEFGVPPSDDCLAVLDTMLAHMRDNSNLWRGWTYWAAGRWWGNYPFSIQPRGDREAPQTAVLKKYLGQ